MHVTFHGFHVKVITRVEYEVEAFKKAGLPLPPMAPPPGNFSGKVREVVSQLWLSKCEVLIQCFSMGPNHFLWIGQEEG